MSKYNIVTIEREFASGGRLIGKKVAEQLNVSFYNENILEMAAKEFGVDKEYIMHAEENVTRSFLYDLALSAKNSITGSMDMSLADKLFLKESEIIKDMAMRGNAVIVGRCADYILRDRKDVLTVYIYSNFEDKLERGTGMYNIPKEFMSIEMKKNDKRRSQYYVTNTGMKWEDKHHYHLCLNSGLLGEDACVKIIVDTMRKTV